jgi:hypothetical protein
MVHEFCLITMFFLCKFYIQDIVLRTEFYQDELLDDSEKKRMGQNE